MKLHLWKNVIIVKNNPNHLLPLYIPLFLFSPLLTQFLFLFLSHLVLSPSAGRQSFRQADHHGASSHPCVCASAQESNGSSGCLAFRTTWPGRAVHGTVRSQTFCHRGSPAISQKLHDRELWPGEFCQEIMLVMFDCWVDHFRQVEISDS